MKCLVVYYSRSGTTKKVAEKIADILKCDREEIMPVRKYSGLIGWIISGYEAAKKKLPEIMDVTKVPDAYDAVIIGTPVWAGTMSSPVRTFIRAYGDRFKKICCFATRGGDRESRACNEIAKVVGKQSEAVLELRKRDVEREEIFNGDCREKIEAFIQALGI
jgi:flavodoxin